MKVTITTSREDMTTGTKESPWDCAVALATKRIVKDDVQVSVGIGINLIRNGKEWGSVSNFPYGTDEEVDKFIFPWDRGEEVEPFSKEYDIPIEFLRPREGK